MVEMPEEVTPNLSLSAENTWLLNSAWMDTSSRYRTTLQNSTLKFSNQKFAPVLYQSEDAPRPQPQA
jgi:hypothetical protein